MLGMKYSIGNLSSLLCPQQSPALARKGSIPVCTCCQRRGREGVGIKNSVSIALPDMFHTAAASCGKGNKSTATPCSLILPKAPFSFALHTHPTREPPRQLLMPAPRVHFTPRGQSSESSQEAWNLEIGFVTTPWTITTVVTVRSFCWTYTWMAIRCPGEI